MPLSRPRLDNNPFFHDYLQGTVERELAAKGFERSVSGTSDLLIHYHADVSRRFSLAGIDREYVPCRVRAGDRLRPLFRRRKDEFQ